MQKQTPFCIKITLFMFRNVIPQRLLSIDAPCRSAFASRHGAAKTLGASDTGAALTPMGFACPRL